MKHKCIKLIEEPSTVRGKRRPIGQLISELSTIIRDSPAGLDYPLDSDSNPVVLVAKINYSDIATRRKLSGIVTLLGIRMRIQAVCLSHTR